MNYNVVHLTDKTIEGTLFDRFGRNNFIDRFILEFEDILIDEVVENDYSKNFILVDLVYSMEGEQWNLLKNNAKKIKKLLKRKNFILVFCYEYESLLDRMLDDIRKNLNDNEKILEIFAEIVQDLKNYELEQRISELESKFLEDMIESTFNKIKELKKLQKIN